jgi:hypothetical protein
VVPFVRFRSQYADWAAHNEVMQLKRKTLSDQQKKTLNPHGVQGLEYALLCLTRTPLPTPDTPVGKQK